jgi:hypothetical protein
MPEAVMDRVWQGTVPAGLVDGKGFEWRSTAVRKVLRGYPDN